MERSRFGHGIHARYEKVRHQGLTAYFEPFLIGLRGVESVEQHYFVIAGEPLDDPRRTHRHRVAERRQPGPALLCCGLHHGEGFGRIADGHGVEMMPPQRRGAGFQFFHALFCHLTKVTYFPVSAKCPFPLENGFYRRRKFALVYEKRRGTLRAFVPSGVFPGISPLSASSRSCGACNGRSPARRHPTLRRRPGDRCRGVAAACRSRRVPRNPWRSTSCGICRMR